MNPIFIEVVGEFACFTRIEYKVERVSYDVLTPTAAMGILRAVFWKPEMEWSVNRIFVCKPIQMVTLRRNEVKLDSGRLPDGSIDINAARTQRYTTALKDVRYVIEASVALSGKDPTEVVTKYVEMARRRVAKGQRFQTPYLGCREFAARVALADIPPSPSPGLEGVRPLGMLPRRIDYVTGKVELWPAILKDGVLEVADVS